MHYRAEQAFNLFCKRVEGQSFLYLFFLIKISSINVFLCKQSRVGAGKKTQTYAMSVLCTAIIKMLHIAQLPFNLSSISTHKKNNYICIAIIFALIFVLYTLLLCVVLVALQMDLVFILIVC